MVWRYEAGLPVDARDLIVQLTVGVLHYFETIVSACSVPKRQSCKIQQLPRNRLPLYMNTRRRGSRFLQKMGGHAFNSRLVWS